MADAATKTPAKAPKNAGGSRGPRRDWTTEYTTILSKIKSAKHGQTLKVQQELAAQYGVSVQTIQNVVRKAKGGRKSIARGGRGARKAAASTAVLTSTVARRGGRVAGGIAQSTVEALNDAQLADLAATVRSEVQRRVQRLKALEKLL